MSEKKLLSFLPFLLFHSFANNIVELPNCTQTHNVTYFRSEVIRKRIPTNSSFCIRSYRNDVYNGNLAFVFNNLSGIDPVLYFSSSNEEDWRKLNGTAEDGGASTSKHPGILYLENKGNKTAEVNFAYTTFFNECDDFFISGKPDDKIDLLHGNNTKHCYFNGINGSQKIKMRSKRSKDQCRGMLYPKMQRPCYLDSDPVTSTNDQGFIQFAMYICDSGSDEGKNTLTVKADENSDSYVHAEVKEEPAFYQREHAKDTLTKTLCLSIGIPLFIISIALFFVDCEYCCDWECWCDMTPNNVKKRTFYDYSYSDDCKEEKSEFKDEYFGYNNNNNNQSLSPYFNSYV